MLDGVDIKEYKLVDLRKTMGLVMQEPTLFNYTIYENILYGMVDAKNSEIKQAATISNAMEFIESNDIMNAFEDTSQSLFKQLEKNSGQVKAKVGETGYNSRYQELGKIVKEDLKKGTFDAHAGEDIDDRTDDLRDGHLSNGFHIQCGIKGSKLSGG